MDRRLSGGAGGRPSSPNRCIDAGAPSIASGPSVWDGILDARPPGACTRAFPLVFQSAHVAGDTIKGEVFKCALKPVAVALRDGSYSRRPDVDCGATGLATADIPTRRLRLPPRETWVCRPISSANDNIGIRDH